MNAYFTCTVARNEDNIRVLGRVEQAAKLERFKVSSIYTRFSNLDEYRKLNDEEAFTVFRKSEKVLKDSDVLIADVSYPSNRIGFEIATAISQKKPVLAIQDTRVNSKLSPPVQGNKSKHLKLLQFSDDQEMQDGIQRFLSDAKKQVDSKFILIISPEIDKYLEWASQERRVHKAQVVRNAIEGAIGKDKEYKDFLKSID